MRRRNEEEGRQTITRGFAVSLLKTLREQRPTAFKLGELQAFTDVPRDVFLTTVTPSSSRAVQADSLTYLEDVTEIPNTYFVLDVESLFPDIEFLDRVRTPKLMMRDPFRQDMELSNVCPMMWNCTAAWTSLKNSKRAVKSCQPNREWSDELVIQDKSSLMPSNVPMAWYLDAIHAGVSALVQGAWVTTPPKTRRKEPKETRRRTCS